MIELLNIVLVLFMIICAIAAIRVKDLMSSIFLLGAFSFFTSILWALLGATDVSFTEAMVGVGASTIFLLLALFKTKNKTSKSPLYYQTWLAASVTLALGALFVWGSADLPAFGDPAAIANTYLSPYFLKTAIHDMNTPNAVTAVLADYRGFDTLLETAVVFTAGIACLLIMRRNP